MLVSSTSETLHLVQASVDVFDGLPPNLTRSISDLRELDAVLATGLDQISAKLNSLHQMMLWPERSTAEDRLRLLKGVTDDTRVFRRAHGVEDKIRVATNTCEAVSQTSDELSTLIDRLTDIHSTRRLLRRALSSRRSPPFSCPTSRSQRPSCHQPTQPTASHSTSTQQQLTANL